MIQKDSHSGSLSSMSPRNSSVKMKGSRSNYEEFRKKSYWKNPNEKTESVQAFIKIMREKQKSQRKKQRSMRKRQESQRKLLEESKEKRKLESSEKLKEELHS